MSISVCSNCGDVFEPEIITLDDKNTLCKKCKKKVWWTIDY